MPKIKTIILDGSGTIINDLHAVWNADAEAFKFYGLKFVDDIEKFKQVIKFPIPEFCRDLDVPEALINKLNQVFLRVYPKYQHMVKAFPEVETALEKLKKEKITIGVVSNIPGKSLREYLQKFGVIQYFDSILGQGDCNEHKPSPKLISLTLGKFGTKPEEAIYVGDMEDDIIMGKKANVITVAISREDSFHPVWKLKRQDPDYFISDLNELLDIVKEINSK